MNIKMNIRLVGILTYLLAMIALQQVIVIPLIALALVIAIYKAKSDVLKAHAKYILSVFAAVSVVMLIVSRVFAPSEAVVAATFAVAVAFMMLAYGGLKASLVRKPFA